MKLSELKEYKVHPIRKQMVFLPSPNVAEKPDELDNDETMASKSLQVSIAENGVLQPITVCGKTVVDGLRRLEIAVSVLPDDAEIPVAEIEEKDVLTGVIAIITTRRNMTIQQRVFNVYQFVRTDYLKCREYGEALRRSHLKSGENFDVAVPHFPVGNSFPHGEPQTDYFSKYLAERELNGEIEAPTLWLAQRLGCARKYLALLDKIWDYLEALPAEERTAKFNAAVKLVNSDGMSLSAVLPSLNGMDSERTDLDDDPEVQETLKKQWIAKCKASFAGLSEKLSQKYLGEIPTAETADAIYEAMIKASFTVSTSAFMAKMFQKLNKQLEAQSK